MNDDSWNIKKERYIIDTYDYGFIVLKENERDLYISDDIVYREEDIEILREKLIAYCKKTGYPNSGYDYIPPKQMIDKINELFGVEDDE